MRSIELGAAGSIIAIVAPLVLAPAVMVRGLRPTAMRFAPWAAAPAFLLAAGLFGTSNVHWDGVLLGMRFGTTGTVTRTFLLLTSCVWLASGLFARASMAEDPRGARFWSFFLLTLSANLGVVLAQDVATFYCFYALMTLASYGLIIHEQTREARRAGLVYLIMALLGEMLLVAACFLIVSSNINLSLDEVPGAVAGSAHRDLIVVLVLVGFGVKAGALLLHIWLPLAHPVAPTPASAVLSGAMIKAGLLGWLRFLPLGIVALPAPGLVCVIAGMIAAFYGIAIGLCQRDPKTILAYSSTSQMGFMTTTLGVALAVPEASGAAVAGILFYAIHHALAKGALFLGTGVADATRGRWPRRLVMLGLLIPALDLAGAPLSSGALAKLSIKDVIALGPWSSIPLSGLLSLGAIGSTILVTHFLTATARRAPAHPTPRNLGLWIPWVSLLAIDVVLVVSAPVATEILVQAEHVWSAIWPVLAGITIFMLARSVGRRVRIGASIPPGDVLVLFDLAVQQLRRLLSMIVLEIVRLGALLKAALARTIPIERISYRVRRSTEASEESLAGFGAVGLVFVVLAGLLLLLAWI